MAELFAARSALLDPMTYTTDPEFKLGEQKEFEHDVQAAFLAIDNATSYADYIALDNDIWAGDFVPAVLVGHADVGGL